MSSVLCFSAFWFVGRPCICERLLCALRGTEEITINSWTSGKSLVVGFSGDNQMIVFVKGVDIVSIVFFSSLWGRSGPERPALRMSPIRGFLFLLFFST